MKLKQGVKITGIRPELLLGLMVADTVYAKAKVELVVTSVCDSEHSAFSLHYAGAAADLRTRHMTTDQAEAVTKALRKALTSDFDVILESTHIHMEHQPRRL